MTYRNLCPTCGAELTKKDSVHYACEYCHNVDIAVNNFFDGYKTAYTLEDVAARLCQQTTGFDDKSVFVPQAVKNELPESSAELKFRFNEDGKSYTVVAVGNCKEKNIIIGTYNGLPVTSIGENAFSNCTYLTNITISNSVTSIGKYAFNYCENLASITIPNSVTSIGESAFAHCETLTNITIPDGVTSIEFNTFNHCINLTNITISNSVTSIGDRAFSFCKNLTNLTIPNSVTSIGDLAFCACQSLTSITIPNSVITIGQKTFTSSSNLTSITIPNSVTSIGDDAFCRCENLKTVYGFKGIENLYAWDSDVKFIY